MFFYNLNGQQQGPVSEEQLRQMVATGAISPETLVWREGMADWQPLASAVAGVTSTVRCSVCGQMFPPDQTLTISGKVVCANCKPKFVQGLREGVVGQDASMYAIALNQRRLIMAFGVQLVFYFARIALLATAPAIGLIFSVGILGALLFMMVYVYRLARAMGQMGILYAIALVLPCIGWLILVMIVSRATSALKRAGVKVGFFGVSKETLEQLRMAA
jgi:hypothetical protein